MADEKDGKPLKTVTLTEEQFHQLLAAVRPPAAPNPPTMDESHDAYKKAVEIATTPLPEEFVPCISDETGATFRAKVVKSRSHPKGRIVDLVDYTYPDGHDRHQSEGGLVPDGMDIMRSTKDGAMRVNPMYKQWRYESFYKPDLQRYVGKDASRLVRLEAAAAK